MKKLLKAGCQPYFQMLEKWLCEGDLDDPFQEFMVCQDTVSAGLPKRRTFTICLRNRLLVMILIPDETSCRCCQHNCHLHSSHVHRGNERPDMQKVKLCELCTGDGIRGITERMHRIAMCWGRFVTSSAHTHAGSGTGCGDARQSLRLLAPALHPARHCQQRRFQETEQRSRCRGDNASYSCVSGKPAGHHPDHWYDLPFRVHSYDRPGHDMQ